MLSERERRTLARMERHLLESDPDLVRMFTRAARGPGGTTPKFLLITGLVLLVLGSIVAAVPVALAGMTLAIFALFAAHTGATRFGRAGFA